MPASLSIIARPLVTERAGAFFRRLSAHCDAIAGWFVRRAAIAELRELDDRALRDMGLGRSQIEAAVYGFMTARPAATGSRADGLRRAAPAEAAPWN